MIVTFYTEDGFIIITGKEVAIENGIYTGANCRYVTHKNYHANYDIRKVVLLFGGSLFASKDIIKVKFQNYD